jgi:hypothetical protein
LKNQFWRVEFRDLIYILKPVMWAVACSGNTARVMTPSPGFDSQTSQTFYLVNPTSNTVYNVDSYVSDMLNNCHVPYVPKFPNKIQNVKVQIVPC